MSTYFRIKYALYEIAAGFCCAARKPANPCQAALLCTLNYCLQSHIVRCETHFARGLNFQVDAGYYVHRIQ